MPESTNNIQPGSGTRLERPPRQPIWLAFDRLVDRIVTWAARLGGLLFLAVGLFVFYEVVCRYVFNSPTLWVMDYSIYCVMWAVFLGLAYTMRRRGHVLVDIVLKKISPIRRFFIEIGTHLLILGFFLILFAAGLSSCLEAVRMNELTMSALFIPLYYPMSAIPLGALLMCLEEIATVARLLAAGRPPRVEVRS